MKCPNCSEEVEASAIFCGNCGFQLKTAAPNPPDANAAAPASAIPAPPAVGTMAAATQPAPAYAVGAPKAAAGSGHLTTAVILGVLSLPGAIIPIVGLTLSITALVLAIKHHHAGTGRMVVATVFASIGLLLSLAAWGYNISQRVHHTALAPSGLAPASAAATERSSALYGSLL